jgi:hypothetical protein
MGLDGQMSKAAGRGKLGWFRRMYRRYHAWRAPFPLGVRILCDITFWDIAACAAYVAVGTLCGMILVLLPLLGFLGLARSKEYDDGIDWSDHRMGGQPRNPGPKI